LYRIEVYSLLALTNLIQTVTLQFMQSYCHKSDSMQQILEFTSILQLEATNHTTLF